MIEDLCLFFSYWFQLLWYIIPSQKLTKGGVCSGIPRTLKRLSHWFRFVFDHTSIIYFRMAFVLFRSRYSWYLIITTISFFSSSGQQPTEWQYCIWLSGLLSPLFYVWLPASEVSHVLEDQSNFRRLPCKLLDIIGIDIFVSCLLCKAGKNC